MSGFCIVAVGGIPSTGFMCTFNLHINPWSGNAALGWGGNIDVSIKEKLCKWMETVFTIINEAADKTRYLNIHMRNMCCCFLCWHNVASGQHWLTEGLATTRPRLRLSQWGYSPDERVSVMSVHQADAQLSKRTKMRSTSHVVATRLSTTRLWMTASALIVISTLPWPAKSRCVRCSYSNMVSYQELLHTKNKRFAWYAEMWVRKKMTIILIFCPNFSHIWGDSQTMSRKNASQCRLIG